MLKRLILALCCSLWLCGAAAPESISRYAGRWELVPEESDNIVRAVEKTVESLNFVIRPVARARLNRRSVAFPFFEITVAGSGVRVRHEKGLDVTYASVDVSVQTKAPDGATVTTRMSADPVLTLAYEADDGQRVDRYVLSGDGGKLALSVRLTSAKLPNPLEYTLVYRRAAK